MAYSTMIVNKARGKKGSRGKVRVRGRKKTRNCATGCATPSRNPRKPTALSEATEFIHVAEGYMRKAKREKYQGMAQSALENAERYLVMAQRELDRTAHPASERLEGDADVLLDDVRAMKVALAKGGIQAIRNPGQWDHVQVKRGVSYAVSRNGKRPKYVLVVDTEDGDSWSTTFSEFLRDNKDSPDLAAWKALRVGQTIGVGGGAAPRFEVTGLAAKPARKAPKRNKKKAAKRKVAKKKASKKKTTKRPAKKRAVKRRVTTTTTVTKRVVAERNSAALRNFYNLRQDLD